MSSHEEAEGSVSGSDSEAIEAESHSSSMADAIAGLKSTLWQCQSHLRTYSALLLGKPMP